jgi:hypothetical protein
MKTRTVQKSRFQSAGRMVQGGMFLLIGSLFFSVSCTQSPIFFSISQEVPLREPLIKGTPTNIVEWYDGVNNGVYVANFSSLYRYQKPSEGEAPVWESIGDLPEGQIWGLAATNDFLYLLTSSGLWKTENTGDTGLSWQTVGNASSDYPSIQKIYGNSNRLFAGTYTGSPGSDGNDYAICYDNNGTLQVLKRGVHILSGAAFDGTTHYIATEGSGIFAIPNSPIPTELGDPVEGSGGYNIKGIIYCGTDVVAVNRNGNIIVVENTENKEMTVRETTIGHYTRNALALWRLPPVPGDTSIPTDDPADYPDNKHPKLLLVGIQGSLTSTTQTYTNGYREIVLDEASGALPADPVTVHIPGDGSPTSIGSYEKYISSLGQYPINYLFQVPYKIDKNMPIFASLHGENGLWSYRDHGDGEVVWNAE